MLFAITRTLEKLEKIREERKLEGSLVCAKPLLRYHPHLESYLPIHNQKMPIAGDQNNFSLLFCSPEYSYRQN